jgi:hypothetical protein
MKRRLLPLFLTLLIFLILPPVHATASYVGYSQSLGSQPATYCDNPACSANQCLGAGNNCEGVGQIFQAPYAGTLFSISFQTSTVLPNQFFIVTAPAGSLVHLAGGSSCSGTLITCGKENSGDSFTIVDVEGLSGLSANTFTTVQLANPVTVTNGLYVGVILQLTTNEAALIMAAAATGTCGCTPPAWNTFIQTSNSGAPVIGNAAQSDTGPSAVCTQGANTYACAPFVGATFNTNGTPASYFSQCYGNCNTVVNTNSTHTINFNASITLFYMAQSNLNGFIVNESAVIAQSYTNGIRLYLGIYTVDPTCTGSSAPFTAQCPGYIVTSIAITNPSKGVNPMLTNIAISNGQWFGIAFSASFNGLDINDTSTGVSLFQTGGIMPAAIQQYTSLGAQKESVKAYIQGNVITNGGSGTPSAGCNTLVCGLQAFWIALGGGVVGGLAAFGILFGLFAGMVLYVTRTYYPKSEGGGVKSYAIPMEFLLVIAVLLMIGLSAAGILPIYIPLIIGALAMWLLASVIWGSRKHRETATV